MRFVSKTSVLGLLIGGFALCMTFFGGGAVFAEGEENIPATRMQISPVSNRISISPNQEIIDKFTIANTGSSDFKYKVYAAPYSVTNENYGQNFSTQNDYTKITSWISFRVPGGEWSNEPTFSIGKGEKQTIEYRINAPQDIPAGGQYATLFAESADGNNENGSNSGIKTSSRVGLILYAGVSGDTRREGAIEDFNFSHFLLGGKIEATTKAKNTGNIDFNINYAFEIQSLFGKTLFEKKEGQIVLPGTERRITQKWDDTPWIGIFKVHYRAAVLGDVRDETAVVFVIPLFVIIILILFLTILTIWTIMVIRRVKERKKH